MKNKMIKILKLRFNIYANNVKKIYGHSGQISVWKNEKCGGGYNLITATLNLNSTL